MQIKDEESFFYVLGAIFRHFPFVNMYYQKITIYIDRNYPKDSYLKVIDGLKKNKINYHIVFGTFSQTIYIDNDNLFNLLFDERYESNLYPKILNKYSSYNNLWSFIDGMIPDSYYDKRTDKIKYHIFNNFKKIIDK